MKEKEEKKLQGKQQGDGDGEKQSELANKQALDAKRRAELNEKQTTHEVKITQDPENKKTISCKKKKRTSRA